MKDLAIQLSTEGTKCLYEQIYEYIRNEIKDGKLPAGQKLPSTRSLAVFLQVARSTVDYAYGQLQAEGYIEAKPSRGYYVSCVEELLHLANWSQEDEKKPTTASNKDETRIKYDFSPHAVSLKDFPFATWKKITKNILVDANSEMFALGEPQGDLSLRETISQYLHSSRGVNCKPEQIIIGAGNDYLLMLLEKILGRHVPIAMEEPTYKRAYKVFDSFAYPIQAIPMDNGGMDVSKLRQTNATVAYIMPSHQYPTGVVMPIGRRMELLKWAKEKPGRYLIEDDYDSEFRYRGKPIPALQGSDIHGRVIYMGTFSKSIAPAIRVGYMVLPKALLETYKEKCGFFASTVSRIDQQILNEFIREGYFERYLNKMRKIYRDKHDFLLEKLIPFEKAFEISGENAGLHILLTNRSKVTEKELLLSARQAGIQLYGLSESGSTVLLGYGGLEKEELERGICELKKAWRQYL